MLFSGRQCGGRWGSVTLGDGAIESGSVVIGREGHVELGFRHDRFCGMLNLKSDYVLSVSDNSGHANRRMVTPCCGDARMQLKTNGKPTPIWRWETE